MSHSLHREGTIESLKKDFVMYARLSRWVNREGGGPKLNRIFDIALSEKPNNFGASIYGKNIFSGLDITVFKEILNKNVGFICCFADREAMKRTLKKIKDAEIGVSIVVSGLIDEVFTVAKEIGLKPHTVLLSLGIHGKKELLPDAKVREITTMCGHGLVAAKLSQSVMKKVKEGKITPEEGARLLAKPCPCGIVNTVRCTELLDACRKGSAA
jgi:hypothetical protein